MKHNQLFYCPLQMVGCLAETGTAEMALQVTYTETPVYILEGVFRV